MKNNKKIDWNKIKKGVFFVISLGIIFNTKTKDNYLLFLSDVYYPGWSVMVDNNSSDIYQVVYWIIYISLLSTRILFKEKRRRHFD